MAKLARLAAASCWAAAWMLCAHAQSGSVLVVGPAGSGPSFNSIQAAVDAAQDGDLVLVKATSSSAPISIVGKSITLAWDGAGSYSQYAFAPYGLRIANIAAGQHVVVRGIGLDADPEVSNGESALFEQCAGLVWYERAQIESSHAALALQSCASVVLSHAELSVPYAGTGALPGASALTAVASSVHAYRGLLLGGDGKHAYEQQPATSGGSGATVQLSQLLLTGVEARGGKGGNMYLKDSPFVCKPGADGGAGIELLDAACSGYRLGAALYGGAGGFGVFGICPGGQSGPAAKIAPGATVGGLDGATHDLTTGDGTFREGQNLFAAVSGATGEFVVLAAALSPQSLLAWPLGGIELGAPALVLPLGVIGGSGTGSKTLMIPVGELGAGVEWVPLYLQAAHIAPNGAVQMGPPSAIALLDAAF